MTLYHGSLEIVEKPVILEPNHTMDYGMANRTDKNFFHDYDIVYGPVANDRVYAAFALYEDRMLDKQGLIKELRAFNLADQMLFHTAKALEYLTFIKAEEVSK